MADLNVFQMTNQELHKTEKKSVPVRKSVKESVRRAGKKRVPFNIPANKLKLESLSFFKEADEDTTDDVTADYTPEDDVVIVVDPDMDEVPEDVEDAEAAAEELIGSHVCKCAICGANYVTDAEITEETEIKDETCPVCGEVGDQIVVGVITPTEELSDEDSDELYGDEGDFEDFEEEGEVEDNGEDFEEEEEEEVEEESLARPVRHTVRRRFESAKRRPMRRTAPASRKVENTLGFDEVSLNRMLTTFAKENYANVRSIKISKGSVRGTRLTLEGVVTTTKGSKQPIKFVARDFKKAPRMTIGFKEIGPFTESVKNAGPTFTLECVMKGSNIVPAALRYSYKAKNAGMKESRQTYSVTGRVLSESVRKPARRPLGKNRRTR